MYSTLKFKLHANEFLKENTYSSTAAAKGIISTIWYIKLPHIIENTKTSYNYYFETHFTKRCNKS